MYRHLFALALAASLAACGGSHATTGNDGGESNPDSGSVVTDSGPTDSGEVSIDSGLRDSGPIDAGPVDSGPLDAGQPDSGAPDAGTMDAGTIDAGPADAGNPDAGLIDAGTDAGPLDAGSDAGSVDAGPIDAGPLDAGQLDAGQPDAGPGFCGDGIVQSGEQCDLGSTNGTGQGCNASCMYDCQGDSNCDDGNVCNGPETCAQANIQGETVFQCVAGTNALACVACGSSTDAYCDGMGNCNPSTCGDGCVDPNMEQCDFGNGNNISGSGCEPTCFFSCALGMPGCNSGDICTGETCEANIGPNSTGGQACFAGTPLMNGISCANQSTCMGGICTRETPDGGSPDAGASDGGPDGGSMGGGFMHQPWPQLSPGGGLGMQDIQIVTVSFTGYAYTQAVQDFGASVLTSSYWQTVGSDYGLGTGSQVATVVLDPTTIWATDGGTIDAVQFMGFVDTQAALGNLPAPNAAGNTVYMVYIPAAYAEDYYYGGGTQFCTGYGSGTRRYATFQSAGVDTGYSIIVVADCGAGQDQITLEASHLLFGAATDPNFGGGYEYRPVNEWQNVWNQNGPEPPEWCDDFVSSLDANGGPFIVQREWSNTAAAAGGDPCVPTISGEVFRDVSPDQPFKIGSPGSTVTFTLTGWSNVTTAPWQILAYDGYVEDFTSNPVLSENAIADNGTVTLTLTIPSTATAGQYTGAIIFSGPDNDPICLSGTAPCSYWIVGVAVGENDPVDAGSPPPGDAGFDAGPDFDNTLNTYMLSGEIPGMAIALVKGDQVLYTQGYGFADVDAGTPATADTLFQLASVSKTVTATALMQLVEQGVVSLDDDVNVKNPWSVRNPNFPNTAITYRMLLDHTSSMRDGPQIDNKVVDNKDSPIPLDTFMDGYLTPDGGAYYGNGHWNGAYAPGAFYSYSNAGAGMVGDLVANVSGEQFENYCQDNIFMPLGMTNSSWFLANLNQADIAVPYTSDGDGGYVPSPYLGWPTYPDGQLRTSANQLASFLLAFIGQGTYNGATILQPQTVGEMTNVQFSGSGEGLFWETWSIGNYNLVGHGGLYTGETTSMYFDPSTGAGYVLLINSDVGGVASGPQADALNNINTLLITAAEQAP